MVRSIFYTSILLYTLASCNKTAHNPQSLPVHPAPTPDTLHNLKHMLDGVPASDLFQLALQRTGYDSLLSQTNAFYTLVVPTDSLLIASGYTQNVITYLSPALLVSGIIANQIWNGQLSDSALNGADGYIKVTALTDPAGTTGAPNTYSVAKQGGPTGGLWVNGQQVSDETSGIKASNGYIHVANAFYITPTAAAWTVLQARPEFSYFVAAVRLDDSVVQGQYDYFQGYNGLAEPDSAIFLQNYYGNSTADYTFFVPTNQAFINAGFKTIDDIRAYALTFVYDLTGVSLSPIDSIIYAHWIPSSNLYYFDLLKNPNLNQRQATDLKLTMETQLYDFSFFDNTDPDQLGLPSYGQTYPYKGILDYQVSDTTVSITCNSAKNPPAATVVEHDILCLNSVILHGVDHLFWPY
jgi:hypothetical protein